MAKKIVDISKYNDSINWDVAAPQLDLAICRVQYGSKKSDYLYKQHVENLEAHGIPHAAYAYGCFTSVNDAIVEADDFMSRVSPNAKFLVLDVEDDTLDSCGGTNLARASQAFIDRCKSKGWKVGFYVSHHMIDNGDPYGLLNVKADFTWIPRYGGPKPKFPCELWQYADNTTGGYVEGIGNCDVNCLNGDKSLEWFIGATEVNESYRISIGDFNELIWAGDVKRKVKELFPDYGLWDDKISDSHRLYLGDFNSKQWADDTFSKLKEAFPNYGMWITKL